MHVQVNKRACALYTLRAARTTGRTFTYSCSLCLIIVAVYRPDCQESMSLNVTTRQLLYYAVRAVQYACYTEMGLILLK